MGKTINIEACIAAIAQLPRLPYNEWIALLSGLSNELGADTALRITQIAGMRDERKGETEGKVKRPLQKIGFGTVVHILRQYGISTDELHTRTRGTAAPSTWRRARVTSAPQEARVPPTKTLAFSEVLDAQRHSFTHEAAAHPFFQRIEATTGCNPHRFWLLGACGAEVVFVHRDHNYHIRNAKIVSYTSNAYNRDKTRPARFLYRREDGYTVPFWGEEHLPCAVNTRRDVVIVESEKTLLYAQPVFRWAVWLACGGATGCTAEKVGSVRHLLAETKTLLLFDNDAAGMDGTEAARRAFSRCGLQCAVLRVSDVFADAREGDDVADIVVRRHEGGWRHE